MIKIMLPLALLLAVFSAPAQQQGDTTLLPDTPALPQEELHIRAGVVLLGMLYNTLARVQDHESAQAAVPVIVRLTHDLQTWGQGVSTLPQLDEETRSMYENRYLPAIRRLNDHLRVQGERLAASDYFGSQDLSTALISLYASVQQ